MTARQCEPDFEVAGEDPGIAAFAGAARAAAERPDGFWVAQRAAIAGGLREAGKASSLRLAWAVSVALVVLATGLLTQSPPPAASVADYDPDHDLLVGVERAVRRPVPQALEPARLLAQEMERSVAPENEVNPQ
jgi:hypothetical protein